MAEQTFLHFLELKMYQKITEARDWFSKSFENALVEESIFKTNGWNIRKFFILRNH